MEVDCPKGCGIRVELRYHEGNHTRIAYLPGGEVPHQCKGAKPRKYWCVNCNAPIREDVPCIHRRIKTGEVKPSDLLPKTNHSLF